MVAKLTIVFWVSLVLAGAIYAVMLLWSLPRIAAEAGGAIPFDLRPTGYGLDDARAFLGQLSAAGRQFYRTVQHPLDTAYPALLAATLAIGSCLVAPAGWRLIRLAGALAAIAGAAFDYAENYLVSRLLAADPAALDPALVAAASRATVLKSAFTALAMVIFLAMLLRRLYARAGARR